jgi:hypothetical protein
LIQWLGGLASSLGAGGFVLAGVRVLTSLEWPVYTAAGSATAAITGLLILKRLEGAQDLGGTRRSAPMSKSEAERLDQLRHHLRDIRRVAEEEMAGFGTAPGIEAGGSIRAGGSIEAPGDIRAGAAAGGMLGEPWRSADRQLFGQFRDLLPSSTGVVDFLRDYDFGAAFRWETLEPLDEFGRTWNDAEYRFHDEEVDAERASLHRLASAFLIRLAYESFPEAGGWQAVVPVERRDDFRLDDSKDDVRRVEEINAMSTAVFEQHQRFVAVARRRLAL